MAGFDRLHLIRQVDLFTLRLFLVAVEEKQIGLAAIRENIAASTATKRIQVLEEITGIRLLERGPGGVVTTPAGAVFERHVRAMFATLDDMRSDISAFIEGVRGELTLASARSIIVPFLARELGDFSRDHPDVKLTVRELENAAIVQQVARGEADIGVFVAAAGLDLTGVEATPYRRDRMVAVLPLGHPLAARESVGFGDLLGENLIAVPAMIGVFTAAARREGRAFEPRLSVRSPGVAISLVRAGLGVSVQPECLLGYEVLGKVEVVRLDEPWAVRRIHVATGRDRKVSPVVRALLDQLLARPGAERTSRAV